MKHIIYTTTEETKKSGGVCTTYRTVTAYRLMRGTPERIGTATESFADFWQILMDLMRKHKALPALAFEKGLHGNWKHNRDSLCEAGIANINSV